MKLCSKVLNYSQSEVGYTIVTDQAFIRILFMTDSIIRIRTSFDGEFAEESYSLVMTAWEDRMDTFMEGARTRIKPVDAVIKETNEKIILVGNQLSVEIDKNPFRICIKNQDGLYLHADLEDLGYQEDSNSRRIHTSEIFEGDCFYGFGEKTGTLNKYKKSMTMSPKDAMGYDPIETDSLYKHIPFYIKCNKNTKIASGYFYHTTYECDFDMGREHSNYWKKHSRFRTDGGDIDLFFIAGPSVSEVITRYTDLTGKSCMLPRYALGYLGSSMYYSELENDCDDAILEFIDTAREEQIPIDGFQLSSGYTVSDNKRYVFTWNNKRFKDPKTFFTEMEKRGICTSPNIKPGLLLTHPYLDELKKEQVFIKDSCKTNDCIGTWWGGKGLFADFTSSHTRNIWKTYLKKNVLDYGVTSIWNDNCEYDSIVDKDAHCDFEGKGGTVGQLKSVMSNIMCHITKDAIHETSSQVRPFIVCRSGHAGIQRYAQSWAGDNYTSWDSLKYNIATILGMALCGVTNYGCDIGGFYGPSPEPELLVRWVQNGIFQPRFSIHSTNTDNTVTEPWMYSDCKDYIKDAIQFRYRMIPYYYSLMERAYKTGLPIIQPMLAAFQYDENCYENGVDFMVGDSLLVANVVEKNQTVRDIYLPKDEIFYDYYTRERLEGGRTIQIPVTLASIPMYIRAGAIIPLADNQLYNLHQDKVTNLHIIMAPDKDGEFVLYEDDGTSMDYENGVYLKEHMLMKAGECVTFEVKREGNYRSSVETILVDMIRKDKSPYWVKLNNEFMEHFHHRAKFEAAKTGWYYSQTLKSVFIKYKNPKEDYSLTVSFEEFDILGM
ncbi:alpha-glucosidase [Anaerocolumna cellulosilytica]|uniref:Alpha-glucosidase n=1 Tax=Anaerocolumna cellulosilytica TaxID=433286 RepID=A0A6S6R784_9FIRM|nr:TIM-barrel domain-containing protein [Anaerocolumna cellulosilytica]MBB5193915.1 alpha-glucosidase [Anaerocolumna cellulosilytica]BCJ94871.1 alpha-glucosidase [Anaerocolumna cellulosilytica]